MIQWDAPESFASFVRNRHVELLRFATVLTGSRTLSEDLVQDALERTGTSWRRLRQNEDPEGYVRRIIVNRYLNRLRALRREILVRDIPDEPRETTDPRGGEMWDLLATLPRKQRAVLVLRFYLDHTETQIADMLGCSIGTVKSNSSRAMAKLRDALSDPDRQEVDSQ